MIWFHVHIERHAAWTCWWLGFFRVYRYLSGPNKGVVSVRWNR